MLARLQRALVLTLLLLACAWLGLAQWLGLAWGWRVLGALLIMLPHAPVLALEFMLLARIGDPAPAPRPSRSQLWRAWFGEVVSGVAVFGWRQPFAADAVPDHVGSGLQGRRGVVLVHGFVCNRGLWTPWLRRLRAQGVPFVAVNLEPVFGPIDDYATILEAAVCRVEAATGLAPVIVAHSMGGLATRAWLRRCQGDARISGVITIGSPHHGTWLARYAFSRNARQMRRHSRWLADLFDNESAARRARFTCFYGHCDNIVIPAATATLPEADNRHLAGVAHVHMLSRPEVFRELQRRLAA